MNLKTLCSLVLLLVCVKARAFPEMVRHGYAQCTACHVSPHGGGVLTPYGRQLSGELLSTWNYGKESSFLHGAVSDEKLNEQGLMFGGDVRSIQIDSEDKTSRDGKFFLMQADFQTALQKGPFTAVISVGQIERPTSGVLYGNFDSTEYYGLLQLSEQVSLRAGRFKPSYGINMPDHNVLTKAGLGFSPIDQFDTAEANYLSESLTLSASAARTPTTAPTNRQESVRTLDAAVNFADRFKVGASLWNGRKDKDARTLYGLYGILGFTHHFFTLTEVDLANEKNAQGAFLMSRWGYEIYKGLVPFVQYEHGQSNLRDKETKMHIATAGLSFYPRPHFEFLGQISHNDDSTGASQDAFLLAHYYF